MEKVERISQAYSQAPWRKQMQYLGLFLLIVILIALVAGFYLNVTARAAAIGRDLQTKQSQIRIDERQIAHMKAQLGTLYSAGEMEKRARAYGFIPVDPEDVIYLSVPSYPGRQAINLAPAQKQEIISAPTLPAEYTESLWVWLLKKFNQSIFPLFKVQR